MKKVFITFYSAGNFGDDFFIKIISSYFKNVRFLLLINPKYKIKNLPRNVKILKCSSWIITICNKFISIFNEKSYIKNILESIISLRSNAIKKQVDAIVYIGGSIFMEKSKSNDEIHFGILPEVKREYTINCKV